MVLDSLLLGFLAPLVAFGVTHLGHTMAYKANPLGTTAVVAELGLFNALFASGFMLLVALRGKLTVPFILAWVLASIVLYAIEAHHLDTLYRNEILKNAN